MEPETARSRLLAEQQRLEQTRTAARDLVGAPTEEAPAPAATGVPGAEPFERERDTRVLQRVEAELGEIDAALARLDAGSYGVCELCARPIGDARLEAMPAARYCVDDQARAER